VGAFHLERPLKVCKLKIEGFFQFPGKMPSIMKNYAEILVCQIQSGGFFEKIMAFSEHMNFTV
jgi:hypothetical protein